MFSLLCLITIPNKLDSTSAYLHQSTPINQLFFVAHVFLVGGFNHLDKYYSMGRIIPHESYGKKHVPNHQPDHYPVLLSQY